MDWDNGYHWQWGMAAGFLMLLLWIILILAAVFLVRYVVNASHRSATPSRGDAHRILDERLARGEISVSEYRERWAALAERDSR